ncbi:MAG: ABC transporter substrate-binding protein [Ilumatobacteraceae bacterium]
MTRTARALMLCGAALVMAACGSDAASSTTSPAATTTAATTAAGDAGTTTAASAAPTTTATPGSATPASGAPILVGLANNEGPSLNIPELRYGAEAAVQHINETGGINGSPIKLVTCIDDATPEGALNCANQFVDADTVTYFAAEDVGADAAVPVLSEAGIPLVSTDPWSPLMKTDPNVWVLGPAQAAYATGPLYALAAEGAKSITGLLVDVPPAHELVDTVVQPAADKLGLKIDVVYVSPGNPDFATVAATASAQAPDAVWALMDDNSCTGLIQALRSTGFHGPVSLASCSQYITAAPDDALNTLSVSSTWYPSQRAEAPPQIQQQLDEYSAAMTAAGHGDSLDTLAAHSFATMTELATVMKGIDGPVTAATLKDALQAATDGPGYMRDDFHCRSNVVPAEPSACRSTILVLHVERGDDGKLVQRVEPLDIANPPTS